MYLIVRLTLSKMVNDSHLLVSLSSESETEVAMDDRDSESEVPTEYCPSVADEVMDGPTPASNGPTELARHEVTINGIRYVAFTAGVCLYHGLSYKSTLISPIHCGRTLLRSAYNSIRHSALLLFCAIICQAGTVRYLTFIPTVGFHFHPLVDKYKCMSLICQVTTPVGCQ